MNKCVKGLVIGGIVGLALGMWDQDMMSMTKKYMKKGKKMLKHML